MRIRKTLTTLAAIAAVTAMTFVASPAFAAGELTATAISTGDQGSTTGSYETCITGSGFDSTTVVVVGGISVSPASITADQLCITMPAHAAGTVTVTVQNATESATVPGGFTYVAPPAITSISPSTVGTGGGTEVYILGGGFSGDSMVMFGGAPIRPNSFAANALGFVAPANSVGPVAITVENPYGESGGIVLTYADGPAAGAVTPAIGDPSGGTAVTITGSNFTSDTTVTFGGVPATSVQLVSATTITAVTPAHVAGYADVVVTNAYGSNTTPNAFTYYAPPPPAPTISALSAAVGSTEGGTTVIISGTNLTSVDRVYFDMVPVTSLTINSDNSITVTTPEHWSGSVDVVVSTPESGSATAVDGFDYIAPPTITEEGVSGSPGDNDWYTSPVTVSFACDDGGDASMVCPAPVTVTSDGANQEVSTTVTNRVGSGSYSELFSIDQTAPTVSFGGITDGATYTSEPTPTCEATDATSGVASCVITESAGGGIVNFLATAYDNAGNMQYAQAQVFVFSGIVTLPQLPTLTFTADLKAGDQIDRAHATVHATGFAAGTPVSVVAHSTPTTIYAGTTDQTGALDATVSVPALAAGSHELVLTAGTGSTAVTKSIWFAVDASGTITGVSTAGPVKAAADPTSVAGTASVADAATGSVETATGADDPSALSAIPELGTDVTPALGLAGGLLLAGALAVSTRLLIRRRVRR